MIPVQELRVWNWVYYSENTLFPMYVYAIGRDWVQLNFHHNEGDIWEEELDEIVPIPLTEELLTKIGFLKHEDGWYDLYGRNEFRLKLSTNTQIEVVNNLDGKIYVSKMEIPEKMALHTLQNVYYLETGEELPLSTVF